jgi:hypothetical protein
MRRAVALAIVALLASPSPLAAQEAVPPVDKTVSAGPATEFDRLDRLERTRGNIARLADRVANGQAALTASAELTRAISATLNSRTKLSEHCIRTRVRIDDEPLLADILRDMLASCLDNLAYVDGVLADVDRVIALIERDVRRIEGMVNEGKAQLEGESLNFDSLNDAIGLQQKLDVTRDAIDSIPGLGS